MGPRKLKGGLPHSDLASDGEHCHLSTDGPNIPLHSPLERADGGDAPAHDAHAQPQAGRIKTRAQPRDKPVCFKIPIASFTRWTRKFLQEDHPKLGPRKLRGSQLHPDLASDGENCHLSTDGPNIFTASQNHGDRTDSRRYHPRNLGRTNFRTLH